MGAAEARSGRLPAAAGIASKLGACPLRPTAAAAARLTLQVAAAALLAARLVQAPGGPRVKLDWVVEVRGRGKLAVGRLRCGQTYLRVG